MNREILFRGKRVDNGKWIYGSLTTNRLKDYTFIEVLNKKGHSLHTVIHETIGQYTGLTDKNGVRIFEGDIIKGKHKQVYAVEYSKNIAGFTTRGFGVLSRPAMNYGTMNFYEVIGNIHDNPELLGGETNA